MPLTVQEGAIIGAGMTSAAAATFFYKRKQTLPFKLAYFVSWPLLGTALMWAVAPRNDKLIERMEREGLVNEKGLQQFQATAAQQMEAIKRAAGK